MTSFACSGCGHSAPRWFGRCPECGRWGSSSGAAVDDPAAPLTVSPIGGGGPSPARLSSGIAEVDRILGGGIVPGAAMLLSGDPGAGKSTLVMQMMRGAATRGTRCLLVTGEESPDQVALRAARLGSCEGLEVAASRSLQAVVATSLAERPDVLVLDSIQTLADSRYEQPTGSLVQVRECAAALVEHGKSTGTAVLMVGHVTKDGAVAGPKTLEHLVDVVLGLEGQRDGAVRLLRPTKNRFGSCDETGVFTMTPTGLEAVADPSALLLADRCDLVSGSCVFPTVQGSRPMLVEVQALVCDSDLPQPRRVAIGVEQRRLALLIGVLANAIDLKLGKSDVFVSAVGGLAVREPAADLATCLALHSARVCRPIPSRLVAIGEVGLGGEVRRAPAIERRIAEASRLGFDEAIVPASVTRGPAGVTLHPVAHVAAAIACLDARKGRASGARPLAGRVDVRGAWTGRRPSGRRGGRATLYK